MLIRQIVQICDGFALLQRDVFDHEESLRVVDVAGRMDISWWLAGGWLWLPGIMSQSTVEWLQQSSHWY
jgi:hypothetical protein